MKRIALALAVAVVACGQGEGAAEAACQHFHNVAVDATDGVLTDTELRDKLREVSDTAAGSAVEQEARAMLAAVTSGGSLDQTASDMSEACDPYR